MTGTPQKGGLGVGGGVNVDLVAPRKCIKGLASCETIWAEGPFDSLVCNVEIGLVNNVENDRYYYVFVFII